ncbi:hypothetical protein FJY63_03730 [Candidatus Sumerlaeota bacterium]|nr:hypothetical protein [Candidatus Sumerlaeota bacterium]
MAGSQSSETKAAALLQALDDARRNLAHGKRLLERSMRGGGLLMLALIVLAYTSWVPMAAVVLPFVVLFLLMHHAHLVYHVICGRAAVADLEAKVNTEIGEALLVSESFESKISCGLEEPHFLGITASNIKNIFSAMEIHYLAVCLIVFLAGLSRGTHVVKLPGMPFGMLRTIYVPLIFLWTLANVVFLVLYSRGGGVEKSLIVMIRKYFQPKGD